MIIEALERELPPAMLLLGPDRDRMLRAAAAAAQRQGVVLADRVILRHLSAGDARSAVKFAQTAPFGPFKVVIALLDGATAQSQHILLKVLEEPPGPVRFILVASDRPLPTIVSRCQVVTVAGEGGWAEMDGKVTAQVAAVLNAARSGDLHGLDAALAGWGEAHHAALTAQLAEAATGAGPHGMNQVQARRLLGALGRFAGAHPRLAAHAALITTLNDREQHAR